LDRFIEDVSESEAVSGSCYSCVGAHFTTEDVRESMRGDFSAADVGKGSSEVANHLIEKVIAVKGEDESII
jgi:hypothetical protein